MSWEIEFGLVKKIEVIFSLVFILMRHSTEKLQVLQFSIILLKDRLTFCLPKQLSKDSSNICKRKIEGFAVRISL